MLFGLSVSSPKNISGFQSFREFGKNNLARCSIVGIDVAVFALAQRLRYPMDTPELLTVDQSIAQDFRTCVGPGPEQLQYCCQKLGNRNCQRDR